MTIAAGGTSRAVSEQHFRQLLGNLRAAEPQSTRRQKRSWWRCLGSYLGAALILAGILTAIQPSSSVAPSATTPVRLGPIALASTSGGPTWTNTTVPSLGPLFAISCSTATNCVAVGETTGGHGAAIETTNAGATWSSDTVPSGAPPLLAVSCWAAGDCVAVGGGSSLSTGGIYLQTSVGGSFASETEPTGNGEIAGVSCPTSTYCAAVSYNTTATEFDDILASTNGGATWSAVSSTLTVSSHWVSLDSIQCPSASTCVLSGTGFYDPSFVWTSNAWSTYSGGYYGSSSAYLDALSCPNTSYCLAVGLADTLAGSASGGFGTETANPSGIGQILGDLCVSSTTCALVGNTSSGTSPVNGTGAILATANGGTTWSAESPPSGTGTLFGLGCTPTGICFSVGETYVSGANGTAVLLTDNGDVLDTGTEVTLTSGSSPYAADARAGGSPSEITVDQNPAVGVTEPVNTATGDLSETTTDLMVPGAGVPLQFTRTYDAEVAQAQSGGPAPPLGYGWSDNFGMSLSYSSPIATITEENGAQVSFTSSTANAWCSGLATNFCGSSPRIEATLNHNGGGTWTFNRLDGSMDTLTFSAAGALTSIADAAGDTLTPSTYTGSTPSCPAGDSCVVWTSSASGRKLVLATNGSSQLVEVFVVGTTTDNVTYAYSATGCTWGAMTADLCSVTDPLGNTTDYTYDSGNANTTLDYDILTVTPPGAIGDYVNTYDSAGRVTSQTDPKGDLTRFAYGVGATGQTTTTVSTYPAGSSNPPDVTEYDYWNNVLTSEVTGVDTGDPAVQSFLRDPSSLLDETYTDGDGNASPDTFSSSYVDSSGTPNEPDILTSADALGNTTEAAYNADNQVWCSVDAADYANGTRCPSITPPTSIPGTSYLGTRINVYNASDQLIASIDPLGNTTTYSYTSSGGSEPAGLMYCSVDPADYNKSVSCPAYAAAHVSGTATSTFDAAGDVLSTTDADGHVTSYTYSTSNPGLVATETSQDETVTTYTYDAAGQVTLQVVTFDSYSATTQYSYDASERLVCEVDPYEYAASVRCPTGAITTPTVGSDSYLGATITTYNADDQVNQTTNPLGGITYTAYDPAGEVYCTVAPYEAAQSVTCPALPITTPTVGSDSYLGATITTYNANGEVAQVTNPLGGITLTTYDPAGNVDTTTVESNNSTSDPNLVTAYTYNADNEVYETVVGSGSSAATTLQRYDPNGNVFCSVSANAHNSGTWQCPTTWQVGWITAPPSPTSLYSTTPTSNQANNVTTAFYDADGDEVQTTDPDVGTSITAFDADGRSYCTSDPVNVAAWLIPHSSSTYPYLCPSTPPTTVPAIGSLPDYTTTIYDAAGLTLSQTDQYGNTTSYAYDSAGLKSSTTDAISETLFCYYYQDSSGQCAYGASATGGTGSDLYSETLQSGATTTYTYYPGGAADATASTAGTTTNAYDALGDLTSETYSGTAAGYTAPHNVSYTFFVDGTRDTMTDGTGTTTYTPDATGDITTQAFSAGSGSGLTSNTVSYTYFSTGQLASVVYPSYTGHSTPSATYTYDSLGNMASETDWLGSEVTFSHDGDGNLTAQDNEVSSGHTSGTSGTSISYDNADLNTAATSTLAQTCGGAETLTQSFSGSTGSLNADGQVTEDSEAYSGSCSGQTGYERNYTYGPNGWVIYQGSVVQGANPYNILYNPGSVATEISSHDSSGYFDTYDQTFNSTAAVTTQTPVSGSHGVSSTYGYDTLAALSNSTSGTSATAYSYDSIGQMTGLTNSTGTVGYQYTGDGLEAGSAGQLAWGTLDNIEGSTALEDVSCTSSSFCVAVNGSGSAFVYNGANWSRSDIDGSHTLFGVSCTSSSFCVAVDGNGNELTYNGTTWTKTDIDGTTPFYGPPSCTSTTFCVAADSAGNVLVYNGTTWAKSNVDGTHIFYGVSCTSATFCVAVDNVGNELTYNGTSWTKTDIDGTTTLFGVSCTSSSFCVAVDYNGNELTYNGTSWATTDVDGSTELKGVSCTSSSFCVAVDEVGNELTYNGTSWSTTNIDKTNTLSGVSCTSSSFCLSDDWAGNALVYNGTSWLSQSQDGASGIEDVSCVSSTFCVAVDGSGYAFTYNGTTWTKSDIDGSKTLFGVFCKSTSFCVAVDGSGDAVVYNGTTWTTSDIDGTTPFYGPPSCTSTTFCVAADSAGSVLVYNGTTWAKSNVDGTHTFYGVSCTSTSFCVAVDNDGNELTYNGTTWTKTDIDGTTSLPGVSCTSSSFCVAVDYYGGEVTYNGTGWTKTSIDGTTPLFSVSCTSSSFCVAVDNNGNEVTFNGTSWSANNIDTTNTLSGVSCATSSFCVAVDWGGNLATFSQPVTGSEQLTWDTTGGGLPLVLSDATNYYVYGPSDEPVEQVNVTSSPPTNNPVFLTYTPSDSSWLVTNTTGDELSYYRYDAFGNLALGTPASPFGYAGQYTDTSSDPSGFDNMRARWYQSQTGEFTTQDPEFDQTDEAYEYAGNDPVNGDDPTGQIKAPDCHANGADLRCAWIRFWCGTQEIKELNCNLVLQPGSIANFNFNIQLSDLSAIPGWGKHQAGVLTAHFLGLIDGGRPIPKSRAWKMYFISTGIHQNIFGPYKSGWTLECPDDWLGVDVSVTRGRNTNLGQPGAKGPDSKVWAWRSSEIFLSCQAN